MFKEEMKHGAYQYWEEMYIRQISEVSQNERERRLLLELQEGNSMIGSIHVLQSEFGITIEEGTAITRLLSSEIVIIKLTKTSSNND